MTGVHHRTSIESPNGGSIKERRYHHGRLETRFSVDPSQLLREARYQGNRNARGIRWSKYKEGFSLGIVAWLLDQARPGSILDQFAGMSVTLLLWAGGGLKATGIKFIPVRVMTGDAVIHAARGSGREALGDACESLLSRVASSKAAV